MFSKNLQKKISKLHFKKYRNEMGLFIAEGEKVVNELLDSDYELDSLYSTKKINQNHTILNENEMNKISLLKSPSTILGIFKIPKKTEEVYSDGSVQNGFFLIKDKKLRYEYNSESLFTIFHNNERFFLVKNNDKEIINNITENTEIIKELLNIANNFPNIEEEYTSEDLKIKLEKNAKGSFLKRISIASNKIRMSIFLNDCKKTKINARYFIHNPFFDYKFN